MKRRDVRAEYRRLNHGEAVCPVCQQAFTRRRREQRLCSLRCAGRFSARATFSEVACPTCGMTFTRRRVAQRFCSRRCYRNPRATPTVCPVCQQAVTLRDPRVRFCSRVCSSRGQRAAVGDRVLAILERGQPVSSAALTREIYGAADWPELHALRNAVLRLRQNGHRIVSERNGAVQPRYRLVREGGAA